MLSFTAAAMYSSKSRSTQGGLVQVIFIQFSTGLCRVREIKEAP